MEQRPMAKSMRDAMDAPTLVEVCSRHVNESLERGNGNPRRWLSDLVVFLRAQNEC